jgi:hypothetical protein
LRRRLLNLLTALSLLLFVAAVVFWVRSYSLHEMVWLRRVERLTGGGVRASQVTVASRAAVIYFERGRWTEPSEPSEGPGFRIISNPTPFGPWDAGFAPGMVRWHVGRLAWVDDTRGSDLSVQILTVPFWLAALALAAAPAAWAHRATRRRRRHGHCRSCGYDLRATPDRCPECGTATDRGDDIRSSAASG